MMIIHQETQIAAGASEVFAVLAHADALSAVAGIERCGRSVGGGGVLRLRRPRDRASDRARAGRAHSAGAAVSPVWEPGAYSIVRFSLTSEGDGTRLVIDQQGDRTTGTITSTRTGRRS